LKNVLARVTAEYREWHPGWESLANPCLMIVSNKYASIHVRLG